MERRLPRLSPFEARWWAPGNTEGRRAVGAIVERAAEALAEALGLTLSVRAVAVRFPGPRLAGAEVTVGLTPDGLPAALLLSPEAASVLATATAGVPVHPTVSPPNPLDAAVLGYGLLEAFAALATADVGAPRLLADVAEQAVVSVDVLLEASGGALEHARTVAVQARLPAPMASRLSRRGGVSVPPARIPDLTVPMRLGLGPVRLSAATLAALAPGDALLPDPDGRLGPHGPSARAFLLACRYGPGCRALVGSLGEGAFTARARGPLSPTAQEEIMADTHGGTDGGSLPIDVHVELATLPMPLAEVATLAAGSIVEVPAVSDVRLVVADRTVATGELVEVEDRLAVRVLARP